MRVTNTLGGFEKFKIIENGCSLKSARMDNLSIPRTGIRKLFRGRKLDEIRLMHHVGNCVAGGKSLEMNGALEDYPSLDPEEVMSADGSIWIYGYGSIMAKPNFPFKSRKEGYIVGYRRVFWQGSTDHRGTPEAPGRTVTLTEHEEGKVWGVAFQLEGSPEVQRETLSYLEWREKQYDLRERVDVFSKDGRKIIEGALCYIASDSNDNVNYLGPASLEEIAYQIAISHGPSGKMYQN